MIPRASCPLFMFCAPELFSSETDGVGYHFHVLPSRTRFRRYKGRQVPISYFALPDSFWTVPKALGPIFMFCAPGLIFYGIEDVGSRLHVLCSLTRFRRYRGRQIPF
jgi:hypothetical protein